MKAWHWLAIGVAAAIAVTAFGAYQRHVGARLGRLEAARDSLDHALAAARIETARLAAQAHADSLRMAQLQATTQSAERSATRLHRVADSLVAQLPALVPRDTVRVIAETFSAALDSERVAAGALRAQLSVSDAALQRERLARLASDSLVQVAVGQRDLYRKEARRFHVPIGGLVLGLGVGLTIGSLLHL